MDRPACVSLVRSLEDNPSKVPAFYSSLEAAIAWLMDTTFKSTDPDEKVRLSDSRVEPIVGETPRSLSLPFA